MNNRLTFHIIYTPDTVRYLLFFVDSLLAWSDCAFRLVANGCSAAECLLLERYCRCSDRLSFVQLATHECLPHGEVLNDLQAQNQEPWFGFMDSDIYATGEFLPPLRAALAQQTAIFSCAPIWCTPAEQILQPEQTVIMGEHNQSVQGICLGSSYFALYDNGAVTAIRQRTGIGFERRSWREIPTPDQAGIRALGLQRAYYDTGKALNLLLLAAGAKLAFLESAHLRHLGGLSFIALQRRTDSPRLRLTRLLQRVGRGLQQRRQRWHQPTHERRPKQPGFGRRCARYGRYYSDLVSTLCDNRPQPTLPTLGVPLLDAQMAQSTAEIRQLYQAYATSGAGPHLNNHDNSK